jgi:protein PhnA
MSLEDLKARASSRCELCGSEIGLSEYEVTPCDGTTDRMILTCATCKEQLEDESKIEPNRWRFLSETMWSEVDAVKVVSYRMLQKMRAEGWPQDLLDIFYMDEDLMQWAQASQENTQKTLDSNGVELQAGDSVSIIKDLEVKGAGFTAKRGTTVKNISLTNNPEQIEGRVNGVKIVLLSKFLKKV